MFEKREFPILEFDPNKSAKIDPGKLVKRLDVPECCAIAFFSATIDEMAKENSYAHIADFHTATTSVPIYETLLDGRRVGVTKGFLGAAGAAAQLEELIAMGFSKFIVCGGAGVLQKGIQVGKLVIPTAAVRDEGASYHYCAPSREISADPRAVKAIKARLDGDGIPYIEAKTWTTDAFYRETEDKIALRISEGCVTVEMEASAFMAVAQFRGATLGQILYGGDDLSGAEWDSRQYRSRTDIRRNLVELSMRVCAEL